MFHLEIKKILVIFLLLIIPFNVDAIVSPTSDFYVNDYANVLSNETKSYIMNKSISLNSIDGTQIVVVTVNSLEGMDIESYANKLFNSFGIGSSTKNNGLLILLSVNDRESRIEVGDGLEGILPDGKTGRFQDKYMIPYYKNNNWDDGIKSGYDAFYNEIYNYIVNGTVSNDYDNSYGYDDVNYELVYCTYMMFFAGMFFGLLINSRCRKKNNKKNNKKIIVFIIYNVLVTTFYILYVVYCSNYLDYVSYESAMSPAISHFVACLIFTFLIKVKGGSGRGRYSSSWSSSSHSSSHSSGHFGGGGHSSGGGSSRRF